MQIHTHSCGNSIGILSTLLMGKACGMAGSLSQVSLEWGVLASQ